MTSITPHKLLLKSVEIPLPDSPDSFISIKNYVFELINAKYEDLDILVAVNERFNDRALVESALAELRREGIM